MLRKVINSKEIKKGDRLVVVSTGPHGNTQIKGVDTVIDVYNAYYHYYPQKGDKEYKFPLMNVNKGFEFFKLSEDISIEEFSHKYMEESKLNIFLSQYSEILPEILGESKEQVSYHIEQASFNILGYLNLMRFINNYEDLLHKYYFNEDIDVVDLGEMTNDFSNTFFLHL